MDLQAIVALLVEDEDVNIQIINNIALDLAEPLNIIGNEVRERIAVPRNLNYYEETIPQYLGDLFVQHFRMSRECFEELINVIGNNQRLQNFVIPLQKKKRKLYIQRAENFCVASHPHIIENKKTDAVNSKQKRDAWDDITIKFNSQCSNKSRTLKSLKIKYEGIKRDLKKKDAQRRHEVFKTGGGNCEIPKLHDYEEKLQAILGISVGGLPPTNDNDQGLQEVTIVSQEPVFIEENCIADVIIEHVIMEEENKEEQIENGANSTTQWKQLRERRSKVLRTPAKSLYKEKSELNNRYLNLASSRSKLLKLQEEEAQLSIQVRKAELEKVLLEKKLIEEQMQQNKLLFEAQMEASGGGPPPKIEINTTDEILLSIMNQKTVSGLPFFVDSDSDGNLPVPQYEPEDIILEVNEHDGIEDRSVILTQENNDELATTSSDCATWKKYTPANLQDPVHSSLRSATVNIESNYLIQVNLNFLG
ncbi:hypothetical protein RN001_003763 [Aquatica leii]|uniref:Regulatory protein zeste n=1 Tax=Aquatica leii TaxID=1421715 RepID=A0AAN7SKZ9_9COLE|nr:hypothetical protein RN001_003763 [Aquatica leii]